MAITIKNAREIDKMRQAGHAVSVCHQRVQAAIQPGVTTADLNDLVAATLKELGATSNFLGHHGFPGVICAIVEGYGGHGIGRQMWEEPHIPNLGSPNHGPKMRPGMTLAIEPMLNLGGKDTAVLDDDWTVVTADGSWSAHFEHTVLITDGEAEILTKRLAPVVD